jgi:hypothetical protein
MGNVIQLYRETAFDPEVIKVLCDAYDGVLASVSDANRTKNTEEFVARWIIWLAQQGERDVERLRRRALTQLTRETREHELVRHREFLQQVFVSANGILPHIKASIEKISESVNLLARIDEQLTRKPLSSPIVGP